MSEIDATITRVLDSLGSDTVPELVQTYLDKRAHRSSIDRQRRVLSGLLDAAMSEEWVAKKAVLKRYTVTKP